MARCASVGLRWSGMLLGMSRPTFGVDPTGRLVLSGSGRLTVALHLDPVGARLVLASHPQVTLPWDEYGSVGWVMDGPARDGWLVEAFIPGRAEAGLAVRASGMLAVQSHHLFVASMTRWRRYNHWWASGTLTGHVLPIVPDAFHASCSKERATVQALMRLLAARPDLRERLADSQRVTRLAVDLATRPLGVVHERTGITRDGLDTVTAMHQAGFVHRLGRPLPGDHLPEVQQVLARTQELLASNPHRSGRRTDDGVVEGYIRSNYTDVEPWPFAALVA